MSEPYARVVTPVHDGLVVSSCFRYHCTLVCPGVRVRSKTPKPGVAGSIPAGPVVHSVVPPRVAGRRVPLVPSARPDWSRGRVLRALG